MEMSPAEQERFREILTAHKRELEKRVDRIHEHAREPLEADSSEQAAQLGNVQVVSALENEAVQEITQIDAALRRLEDGRYGVCITCGEDISPKRLEAWPASAECVDCAETSGPR
ncbi:MAG: TraR/DksA family transcriptional regulator [Chromatiales bacterium]|nr:MAG: TraR/DksA family transcriptional regulator [Chromatiales bacterium]